MSAPDDKKGCVIEAAVDVGPVERALGGMQDRDRAVPPAIGSTST